MPVAHRPVVLIIRDGWGHNPRADQDFCNATVQGVTPVSDRLLAGYPHVQIKTSGADVGLPPGVMGNSEVGHQNLGAGRIVDQELMRITNAVKSGAFQENHTLLEAVNRAKSSGKVVHLLGLLSDGGVHSHVDHCLALVDLCQRAGLPPDQLAVHVITDGRDTAPTGGADYVATLEAKLAEAGYPPVASLIGRFYAMDRDFRWDRVQKAYDLLLGRGGEPTLGAGAALAEYYENPTEPERFGDEFVAPHYTNYPAGTGPKNGGRIADGDSVIFYNFRGDRPREITKAFVLDDADWAAIKGGGFDRGLVPQDLFFCTMARYETGLDTQVAFEKPPKMKGILGDAVSAAGLTQFRCAESEKAPHVTFFFNDYREEPFEGEVQQEIPSPREVSTYDQKPEMSARGVTDAVVNVIRNSEADFVLVNFANGDMVGHTGVLEAAVKAVEVVDGCVGEIVDATLAKGGALVVTADHGNCEQMLDLESGRPHTAHTTYDVDLIVVSEDAKGRTLREGGRLADVAPTVLALLGLDKPAEMTGESLLA
ncbi:2,3-bisphosphoglycerate-independent phosphoglycerate mutase [Alienimonas californiensis]|uniref:2,3-bisphosphoglycerate-independent phosphoglycerate mutase n=1 Tax=Alienimonas californiensis TaxID=2527989 RepID=A0A517P3J0_9PLAN|nr:2,3-bisphosphoglycerate-independent phosphoglycerate mutase [Alienimonas californiensis]QDT13939.1 2,3-bisphosphoglycerate-independent phosphoglycerate mutase [Alienimonas californiensis]